MPIYTNINGVYRPTTNSNNNFDLRPNVGGIYKPSTSFVNVDGIYRRLIEEEVVEVCTGSGKNTAKGYFSSKFIGWTLVSLSCSWSGTGTKRSDGYEPSSTKIYSDVECKDGYFGSSFGTVFFRPSDTDMFYPPYSQTVYFGGSGSTGIINRKMDDILSVLGGSSNGGAFDLTEFSFRATATFKR